MDGVGESAAAHLLARTVVVVGTDREGMSGAPATASPAAAEAGASVAAVARFSTLAGAGAPPWLLGPSDSCEVAASALHTHGLIAVGQAASPSLAEEAHGSATLALDAALAMPLAQSQALLGEIREPMFRHDVKLDLSVPLQLLLRELVGPDTVLGGVLAATLGGEQNALLCELSCIVSEPGARAQPAHCDTAAGDASAVPPPAPLFSLFVALQDVSASMGPTLMYPGTHTASFHAELAKRGPLHLRGTSSVHIDLPCGVRARATARPPTEPRASRDASPPAPTVTVWCRSAAPPSARWQGAVLMDSRLYHAGGANLADSGSRRCLLVASFAPADAPRPPGSTYSLLPHLVGRVTLARLQRPPASAHEEPAAAQRGQPTAMEDGVEHGGAEERAPSDEACCAMPLAAAHLLQRLAATLPPGEPRARQCLEALARAVRSDDEAHANASAAASATSAMVPISVLRVLCSFRVVGPHLRASPRFGPLQRLVDGALASDGEAG